MRPILGEVDIEVPVQGDVHVRGGRSARTRNRSFKGGRGGGRLRQLLDTREQEQIDKKKESPVLTLAPASWKRKRPMQILMGREPRMN